VYVPIGSDLIVVDARTCGVGAGGSAHGGCLQKLHVFVTDVAARAHEDPEAALDFECLVGELLNDNDYLLVEVLAQFEGVLVLGHGYEVRRVLGVFFFDVEDGAEDVLVRGPAACVVESEVGEFLRVRKVGVGVVSGCSGAGAGSAGDAALLVDLLKKLENQNLFSLMYIFGRSPNTFFDYSLDLIDLKLFLPLTFSFYKH